MTIVFLKAPEPGKVKTRLSRFLDKTFVLDLYKGFVSDTLAALKPIDNIRIYFWPPEKKAEVKHWLGNEYACFPQTGEDLGKKMSNAFKDTFLNGYETAVLMGTDIPEFNSGILLLAQKALQTKDVVIGPTVDGGYYLIGFKSSSFSNIFFNRIDWSTPAVFDQTLCLVKQESLSWKRLPLLEDIDTVEDLKALLQRVKSGGKVGKKTFKMLALYED